MKICPVCHGRCFDDMELCYGCLHRFDREPPENDATPSSADQATAPISASAVQTALETLDSAMIADDAAELDLSLEPAAAGSSADQMASQAGEAMNAPMTSPSYSIPLAPTQATPDAFQLVIRLEPVRDRP